ncbi:DUF4158 domain-containing protein, partial [Escherichia coli]|uniref:DUF4158 domain-containing protein n=1 Tax=Escherichia coli TaxID=562 RepID=UPI00254BDCBB
MPVDFLTTEQTESYGRFTGEPDELQLARYFHLDEADKEFIGKSRGDHNRLGIALQIGCVRFLGTFLTDMNHNPSGTVAKLAMRQPFVLFKGLTFQKLCLPGAYRPG